MFTKLTIKNFKSIVDDTIELGRINVFIGENGCGKSNILEAVAMLSAAKDDKLDSEGMYNKGIRVAKPSLLASSFAKSTEGIDIEVSLRESGSKKDIIAVVSPLESQNIFTKWVDKKAQDEVEKLYLALIDKLINHTTEEERKESDPKKIIKSINHFFLEGVFDEIKDAADDNYNLQNKEGPHTDFSIYCANIKALRGIQNESLKEPLGINGENLDRLLASFTNVETKELIRFVYLIDWLKDYLVKEEDVSLYKEFKLGKSNSNLYFRDKFMKRTNAVFSAENANEGVLFLLFYLALFISKRTPEFFAIDNIETSLNPHLCRKLSEIICQLAKENNKQALITTHNPAILDGLNLNDDEIRLFEVYRTDEGHTKTRRIKVKPEVDGKKYKLSELWMRGHLGAISKNF